MKKYIILTNSITNMGGGQMFVANKSIYLRNHGWDVYIFFSNPKGDIYIPELNRYKDNCIPNAIFPFFYMSKKERQNIISKVISCVSSDDEVVIESHTYVARYWGELIAKCLNCKHIIFDLEENIPEPSNQEAKYLEWKLKRREILNSISEKLLIHYFGKKFKVEYLKYTHKYMELAYCSNVTTNIKTDLSQIQKADFTILSIGRLDKPYIIPSVEKIVKFANKYKEYKLNLLFVGGSTKGTSDEIINKICEGTSNIYVHHFGYIFPIPENIIDSADIAFASSNSVLVSAERGIPTISIDVQDMLPIGIYGKTTNSHFLRGNEPVVEMEDLLRETLIEKKYVKTDILNISQEKLFEETFRKQIEFLSISPNDGKAYDIEKIFPLYKILSCRLKRFLRTLKLKHL